MMCVHAVHAQEFNCHKRLIHDAKNQQVMTFACEGFKKDLEAVVFSLNTYADHSLKGFRSLREFGSGHISGCQIAFSGLERWASSPFSSVPEEVLQNQKFRDFLVQQNILTANFKLAADFIKMPASILIYFRDMRVEYKDTEVHEISHVFYNNLVDYKNAAMTVYSSLSEQQHRCIMDFFKSKPMYDIEDQDLIRDEFIAYYMEKSPGLKSCYSHFNGDMNQDGIIGQDERYLWDSTHPNNMRKTSKNTHPVDHTF